MDWLGITIFFAGAVCFTMALNFGGTVYGWSSGPEIVLWVCAGILLIGFILVSYHHPFVTIGNRLYPLHFYRTIEFANLQLQILLVSGAILTTAYYIPLYFQFARGDDAMQAAVRLLPFVLALVVASLCNGFFMPRVGYHKPWFVGGSALYLVGCALMCTFYPILTLTPSRRLIFIHLLLSLRLILRTEIDQSLRCRVRYGPHTDGSIQTPAPPPHQSPTSTATRSPWASAQAPTSWPASTLSRRWSDPTN